MLRMINYLYDCVDVFAKKLILGIFTIIVVFLFLACIFKTVHIEGDMDITFNGDSLFLNMACLAIYAFILFAMKKIHCKFSKNKVFLWMRSNINIFFILITILVACFLYLWISLTKFYPASDAFHCFNWAKQLMNGNNSVWIDGYMSVYPFQNGIVFYDILLLKAFGDGAYVGFQYINIVWFLIAVWSIYGISKYLFNGEYGISLFCSLILFYPFAIYVVFCYGTLFGFAFAMLSIYFLMRFFDKRKMTNLVMCGMSIGISVLMKSNYLIILVGIILYLIFDTLYKRNKKSLYGLTTVILIYLMISKSFYFMVEKVTEVPLASGIPKVAWVAMGFQEQGNTPGWFNNYNGWVYEKNNRDEKATINECILNLRHNIKNMVTRPRYMVRFFYQKLTSEWNNPTWECFNIQEREFMAARNKSQDLVRQPWVSRWERMLDFVQTIINAGLLLYVINRWKNFEKLEVYELINAVMMIGAFIFYTFWEAKSQYAAPYYYMIIPYAVIGWKMLLEKKWVK